MAQRSWLRRSYFRSENNKTGSRVSGSRSPSLATSSGYRENRKPLRITPFHQRRNGVASLALCPRENLFEILCRADRFAIDLQQDIAAANALGGGLAARFDVANYCTLEVFIDLELTAKLLVERSNGYTQIFNALLRLRSDDSIAGRAELSG